MVGRDRKAALMRLRIGHLSTFYHTAVILMADANLNEKIRADTEWKLFGTGPAIVKAFEKGELDMAYIGLPPAIIGMDRGVALRCVAGGHVEGTVISGSPRYRGLAEIGDLGDFLAQFRGLRIGVPAGGSIHDVIIREYIDRYNLGESIEVVNFAWSDQVTEAVVKGEVAAAVGTPALAAAVIRYAGGRVLCPPSEIWPNNPSYGIVVHTSLFSEGEDIITRFLEQHEAATGLLRERTPEAARIISRYVGFIDEEFVLETLKISPRYCAKLTDAYVASTMEFVVVLKRLGYIKNVVPEKEIFDPSYIDRVHPGKDHYSYGLVCC